MTLREMYAERLKAEGVQVNMAKDGEEALQMATENHPNVILLDIMMPKINGLDVLKKLKEQPDTKNIPVIVLTNLEGVEEVDKAVSLGATTYLVKSQYSLEELVSKIKEIVSPLA